MSNEKELGVGTRVTVYWPDDDRWYKGTVASAEDQDQDRAWIKYDDGDEGWLDFKEDKWRRSTKPELFLKVHTGTDDQKQKRIDKLKVGARICVWFPLEKEYFTGTFNERKNGNSEEPHHIKYDDEDEEWTDLFHRNFKKANGKADKLEVGSRVAVYDEERRKNYYATVIKINPSKARQHQVKYDKESRGKGWLNLHASPFVLLAESFGGTVPSQRVNARTLKKRKGEFMDLGRKKRREAERQQEESQEKPQPEASENCVELCSLCKKLTETPRAASCHHIFCENCATNRIHRSSHCLLCKLGLISTKTTLSPENDSFKAVEALSTTTAEVQRSYSSASTASLNISGLIPAKVIDACRTKKRDEREYKGYYWRFKGSKDRILRVGEAITDGFRIEQIDLTTKKVIEVFQSMRKAHTSTGVGRITIRRVLERIGSANGGGYFWRYEGETHAPWPDPEPTNLKPVEQLDFETGQVLQKFKSLAEAKFATGLATNDSGIRDVCDERGRGTAKGYFWRWKGSQKLPDHLLGAQKIIEMRKKKDGNVVKEFRTSRDAQAFFGHQCCWSTICRYSREEGKYGGYYLRYREIKKKKPKGEEIVGRRLRVKEEGAEWFEGKVIKFYPDTQDHEIEYDCGTRLRMQLDETEYVWKNDQGQKPVEQLDLETGQVLANFNSISDASRGHDISKSQITAVCRGRCKSSGGYFWRYKGSNALPQKKNGRRQVDQLCLITGRVIATFDTITAAAKAVGISSPGISYCCNGRNSSKSAGGFGWKFSETNDV